MADEPTILGTCTVIVAREGAVDALADDALLRDVASALGLQPGSLPRANGMSRPEFRLVEGVSRATADRVAALAVRHGFNPRVRERLGIKWSSERNPLGLLGLMMGLTMSLVFYSALVTTPGSLAFGIALFGLGFLTVMLGWRRLIYMPLAVPRAALPGPSERTPMRRASDRHEAEPEPERRRSPEVDDAARQARRALDGLQRLLSSQALPAVATSDLRLTHGELLDRVDALQSEAADLPPASTTAVQALRTRMASLADPASEESQRLAAAIEDEEAVTQAAEARVAAIVTDLLAIRRTVVDASNALNDVPDADDAAARLQTQIGDLRRASEESRKVAAARARQAALTGLPR